MADPRREITPATDQELAALTTPEAMIAAAGSAAAAWRTDASPAAKDLLDAPLDPQE